MNKEKNKQVNKKINRMDCERHMDSIKLFKIHLNLNLKKRGENVVEEIFEENF